MDGQMRDGWMDELIDRWVGGWMDMVGVSVFCFWLHCVACRI